ncbi:MAG: response regulator [Oscillochloris sp.]|nr:response regulator [Oscillochloris sp.]
MQLLLVDDNQLMQQVIKHFLVSEGYEVLVAGDGAEALALAQANPCRLLLVDMRLPDYDGRDLLPQLRRLPGMRNCPAVAISGLGEDEREMSARAGFDGFLAKPIDLDELAAMVRRHLGDAARACGV